MNYIEDEKIENNASEIVPVEDAKPTEDPSIKKRGKGTAIGLTIPAFIFLCVMAFFGILTIALYNDFKEVLLSGDTGTKVIASVFFIIFYVTFAVVTVAAALINTGLSIPLLINNVKKNLAWWYPVVFLTLDLAAVTMVIISFASIKG
ncbi:MAG: hypothetical protein HUJ59_01780 [Bacilli bacterium]|nr:hypothetical protein [Bacilli bacterium]